ncbi:hypothetical protein BKA25_000912 [Actinoalloteichus hymeniacidonis]|nr:hypothetical protein [Actinoalloteichus hymeniacidonis]
MCVQDRGEHIAIAATDVEDRRESAPVVALRDLRRHGLETPAHLGVERAPQRRFGVQVGPEVASVAVRIGGGSGGDRREQLDEGQFGAPARAVDVE